MSDSEGKGRSLGDKPRSYMLLYKYMPFNDGALSVITDGTMKYTCPLEFNDPFDCKPSHCRDALKHVYENRKDLMREIARRRGWSPAERIRKRWKLVKEVERIVTRESHLTNLMRNFGIVSLSEDPTNVLMWSHYGNNHKGLVVEFRIPLLGSTDHVRNGGKNLIPLRVNYSRERPALRFGIDSELEVLNKIALTKYKDWKYEREWRVLEHKRGPGIHPYNRNGLLNSVVAGMRIDEDDFQRISDAISELKANHGMEHLKVFRAEADNSEYKIRIPGHEKW